MQTEDYDTIVARAAGARYVLLGEASHGTAEFYRLRAEITQRLIAEAGFAAVAVEADWPDAYRVNRFVRGLSYDDDPHAALADFERFPTWMWRNTEVAAFVEWLRSWNDALEPSQRKTGFYGLDLYSLHRSMSAVIAFLEEVEPAAAERARERYSCFDHFGPNPQVYGYETGLGGVEACEQQAIEQLLELHARRAGNGVDGPVPIEDDDGFYAEMNARVVANAEQYYRSMFRSGVDAWNLRDTHMAEMLDELVVYLDTTRGPTKVVVWAHNSHVGDARATEMGEAGEVNLGQLVREDHAAEALLVGFSTYAGTVTAASDWDGRVERKRIRPALEGSWEDVLHQRGAGEFVVDTAELDARRLERAIGVIYRPETERVSHYFHARPAAQFDLLIHIDETTAVEPLEATALWTGDLAETYPFGV
jgi:erythromycin esterase-like protein